jgi:hypothetical protein
MLARKMLTAKVADNRLIADVNIALFLLLLSKDALNPLRRGADNGRVNLRGLAERREDAQVELVRERVFTLRPGSKKP